MGDGDLQRVYSNRLKQLDVLLCNVFIREDRGVVLNFMGQEQNRLYHLYHYWYVNFWFYLHTCTCKSHNHLSI